MRSPASTARFVATAIALGVAAGAFFGVPSAPEAVAQSASRAWFGVEVRDRKDGKAGVLVRHVMRTSPAEAAGLRDGDFLLKLAGKSVSAPNDVVSEVRQHRPGDVLEVLFERAGHEQKARVTLDVFPPADEMLRREKVGTFAPNLAGVESVQGTVPAELNKLRGKVVVLDFWAGWCGVCKLVTPVLNGWQSKFGAQGLVVIGVSSDDARIAAKATNDFGVKYAVGADAHGSVFPAYGVVALPTMYVLDKKGVIRAVDVGFDTDGIVKTQSLIASLLNEPSP